MLLLRLVLALILVAFAVAAAAVRATVVVPPAQAPSCNQIKDPSEIPSPGLIHFDDLPNATVIGDSYRPAYGVRFETGPTTRAII